jgi:hypothetical protein
MFLSLFVLLVFTDDLSTHTFPFSGMNVRLRYFVRVTITRSYNTVVKEQDFAVQNSIVVRLLDVNT